MPSDRSERRRPAQPHQLGGVLGRQAQLQDRHPATGVHDLQGNPSAVVEPAGRVLVHADPGQRRNDPSGQVGGVRGVVAHPEVARVEAREVVDKVAGSRCTQAQGGGLPVRRDDQDAARGGQSVRPAGQLVDPGAVLEQRRRSVADVEGGQRCVAVLPRAALLLAHECVGQEFVEGDGHVCSSSGSTWLSTKLFRRRIQRWPIVNDGGPGVQLGLGSSTAPRRRTCGTSLRVADLGGQRVNSQ